jgi:nucleoside-diphosphate-sugar epimerase
LTVSGISSIVKAMRVAVIGGTGFIGSQVVARLATEHEVTVLHRGRRSASFPSSVRQLIGDRDRLAEHAATFRSPPPDVVLDMISGDERHARTVVDAFRGLSGRLVTVSSMDVYRTYEIALGLAAGAPEPLPLTEDSSLRAVLYPYREHNRASAVFDWVTPEYDKILVERVVRSVPELRATVLRLPMVYGPGDPLHRFHPFLKRMDDGRPVILIEETWARWRGPMGYVEDVAAAIALAVTNDSAAGRTYNIAEADALSWADWAAAIGQAAGWRGRIVTLPRDLTPPHLRPPFHPQQHWVADSSRLRKELGYGETMTRAEALARTIAWERANPPAADPAALDYTAEDQAAMRYCS